MRVCFNNKCVYIGFQKQFIIGFWKWEEDGVTYKDLCLGWLVICVDTYKD